MDCLIVSETKLDDSFPDGQFRVPNYTMYRRDRNGHGGGLIVYIRADIPSRRVDNNESLLMENITIEFTLKRVSWSLLAIYRPPKLSNDTFLQENTTVLDRAYTRTENILIAGDLNYNISDMQ